MQPDQDSSTFWIMARTLFTEASCSGFRAASEKMIKSLCPDSVFRRNESKTWRV
jgi:hypothetical protein